MSAAKRVALGLLVFAVLNANGREIPSADSQAAKYASLTLARRHALTLDGLVGRVPLYGERLAFQRDRQGHWRNAYPLPPVLEAAAMAKLLRGIGLLHFDAPLAANTIAKLTASALMSLAAVFALLIALRFCSPRLAAGVALAFALGTGIWPVAGQTLWQHATIIWSITAAIWLWVRREDSGAASRAAMGVLLGWAVSARPQVLPMIAVLSAGILWRASARDRIAWTAGFLVPVLVFAGLNVFWFGHVLGGMGDFEARNLSLHSVPQTWQWPFPGLLGLLASPNRGIVVFTPIVMVILAARPAPADRPIGRWPLAAGVTQLIVYSSFSVWWGGHTYGPRYLLDVLPVLLPAACLGAQRVMAAGRPVRFAAAAALAWSVVTAGTGAFSYPHERWNIDPVDVDREHGRLWDAGDLQIVRCWRAGLSPQNFGLFQRDAWRRRPKTAAP
jgi:hypothetical protein